MFLSVRFAKALGNLVRWLRTYGPTGFRLRAKPAVVTVPGRKVNGIVAGGVGGRGSLTGLSGRAWQRL